MTDADTAGGPTITAVTDSTTTSPSTDSVSVIFMYTMTTVTNPASSPTESDVVSSFTMTDPWITDAAETKGPLDVIDVSNTDNGRGTSTSTPVYSSTKYLISTSAADKISENDIDSFTSSDSGNAAFTGISSTLSIVNSSPFLDPSNENGPSLNPVPSSTSSPTLGTGDSGSDSGNTPDPILTTSISTPVTTSTLISGISIDEGGPTSDPVTLANSGLAFSGTEKAILMTTVTPPSVDSVSTATVPNQSKTLVTTTTGIKVSSGDLARTGSDLTSQVEDAPPTTGADPTSALVDFGIDIPRTDLPLGEPSLELPPLDGSTPDVSSSDVSSDVPPLSTLPPDSAFLDTSRPEVALTEPTLDLLPPDIPSIVVPSPDEPPPEMPLPDAPLEVQPTDTPAPSLPSPKESGTKVTLVDKLPPESSFVIPNPSVDSAFSEIPQEEVQPKTQDTATNVPFSSAPVSDALPLDVLPQLPPSRIPETLTAVPVPDVPVLNTPSSLKPSPDAELSSRTLDTLTNTQASELPLIAEVPPVVASPDDLPQAPKETEELMLPPSGGGDVTTGIVSAMTEPPNPEKNPIKPDQTPESNNSEQVPGGNPESQREGDPSKEKSAGAKTEEQPEEKEESIEKKAGEQKEEKGTEKSFKVKEKAVLKSFIVEMHSNTFGINCQCL